MAFSWLAKKVVPAPPTGAGAPAAHELLGCVGWGPGGWLAVGGARVGEAAGASGSLQLLQLAPPAARGGERAPLGAPPSVGLECVLAAHDSPLTALEWSHANGKLVTADASGLVVVWGLREPARPGDGPGGEWVQELVNRRAHTRATAIRWRSDGELIVIAYADGAVVVGTAGGTRVWAKDDVASGRGVSAAAWSPDGGTLLFGCGGSHGAPAAVLVYSFDAAAAQRLLPLPALAGALVPSRVAAIEWCEHGGGDDGSGGEWGSEEPAAAASSWPGGVGCAKRLAVCFANGRVQLQCSAAADASPLLLDTGLAISSARWAPDGSVLAIGGVLLCDDDTGDADSDGRGGGGSGRHMGAPSFLEGGTDGGRSDAEHARRDGTAVSPGAHGPSPAALVQFYSCAGAFLHTLALPDLEADEQAAWAAAAQQEQRQRRAHDRPSSSSSSSSGGGGSAGARRPSSAASPHGAVLQACLRPCLSWDPTGVRLAVGRGAALYFATVRLPRWWAAVGDDALVLSYRPSAVLERAAAAASGDATLLVLNTRTGERHSKLVRRLLSVHGASGGASADYCILVCAPDPRAPPPSAPVSAAHSSSSSGGGTPASPRSLAAGSGASGQQSVHSADAGLAGAAEAQFLLIQCDALGSAVASTLLGFRPEHVAVTADHAVALNAAGDRLLVLDLAVAAAASGSDDSPIGCSPGALLYTLDALGGGWAQLAGAAGAGSSPAALPSLLRPHAATAPSAVACVAARTGCLLIARTDGSVAQLSLPCPARVLARFQLRTRPLSLALNADCTCAAVIDADHDATLLDLGQPPAAPAPVAAAPAAAGGAAGADERPLTADAPLDSRRLPPPVSGLQSSESWPGVWAVVWAEDAPDSWAACAKAQVLTFRGLLVDASQASPPSSLGHPIRMANMAVTCALLDEAAAAAATPAAPAAAAAAAPSRFVATHDVPALASLRRELAAADTQLPRMVARVRASGGHAVMWRLLADEALARLELRTAHTACLALGDYAGLLLLRRLRNDPELRAQPALQRAAVHAHCGRLDAAEAAYASAGRVDLAVGMRAHVGHWQRMLELVAPPPPPPPPASAPARGGGAASMPPPADPLLQRAHLRTGDYWADRQDWRAAAPHYAAAGATEVLAECLCRAEDYGALAALSAALPSGAPLLPELASRLGCVGMADEAVAAWERAGRSDCALAVAARLQRPALARAVRGRADHAAARALIAAGARDAAATGGRA